LKRSQAVKTQQDNAADLVAPMPCKVVSISVKCGDRISKGSTVAVLEAMKMEVQT
jgi:3-methylcrotonyl-CoA carboxylase alpha subunit